MKKIAIALIFLFVVGAKAALTNGLIAYYPLNANAADASGNGHGGILNGASGTNDRYGAADSALSFSPTNNVLTTFIPPLSNADRTVSLWFSVPNNFLQMTFLSYGGGDVYWGDRFEMKVMENGQLGFDVSGAALVTTNKWKDSKWHQFVVVVPTNSMLTNVLVFIDGKPQSELSYYENAPLNTADTFPLTIGQLYLNGGIRSLAGKLDEVRVYDYAFSSNEVAQLYAIESPTYINLNKAVYLDSATLKIGTNYQLQVSVDSNSWTNFGTPFVATNYIWSPTNFWHVDNWDQLFFRLKALP